MAVSMSSLPGLSLCGTFILFLTACGGAGITAIETTKPISLPDHSQKKTFNPTSNASTNERKAIAVEVVEQVQKFNTLMLGHRQITDAKIHGPAKEKDWLTDNEFNVYCTRFQVKADRADYLSGELRYIARVSQYETFSSIKLERTQHNCASDGTTFQELNQLSAEASAQL